MNAFLLIEQARVNGKKIGFTASSFDLLHPGHISMLAEARSRCDFLVVGLLSDPTISRPDIKHKPIQSTFERFVQIQAIEYIDVLIPFDTEEDLVQMIKMIQPDIRFCGSEYKGTKHTGYDIPGIYTYYNRRDHDYSTTELRKRIYHRESEEHPIQVNKCEELSILNYSKREELKPGYYVAWYNSGSFKVGIISSHKDVVTGGYDFAWKTAFDMGILRTEKNRLLNTIGMSPFTGYYICNFEEIKIIDEILDKYFNLQFDAESKTLISTK